MSDDRAIAGQVLKDAFNVITTERGNQHGGAENSFQMIADDWTTYLKHVMLFRYGVRIDLVITPADVALMMVRLKQARAVYGNPNNPDNAIDAAGYTALGYMLSMPDDADRINQVTEKVDFERRQAALRRAHNANPVPSPEEMAQKYGADNRTESNV